MTNRLTRLLRKPAKEQIDSAFHHFQVLKDTVFERMRGFEFDDCVPASRLRPTRTASLASASPYEPVSSVALTDVIREALFIGGSFERFVDIGCGKGKACIYAGMRFPFPHVCGIDFSPALVEVAERNLAKTALRQVTFEHADAADWRVPPGRSLVLLYNPFGADLLRRFVENNLEVFREDGSMIAYVNDVHRGVLHELGFEVVYRMARTVRSLHVFRR